MKNVFPAFIVILSSVFYACNHGRGFDQVPASIIPGLPSQTPESWFLAHVDVETTGLIPGYHEMIDIGLVYTDLSGLIKDSLYLRIQPRHPQRLDPGAFEVNAFDPQRWSHLGALAPNKAVDSIRRFHQSVIADKSALMIAHNSYFDAAFLDHLFRTADASWRELFYFYVLDIPSMAWAMGFHDLTGQEVMQRYQIQDEPQVAMEHTGITGALKNVRVYQALLKYQQEITADQAP